MYYNLFLLIKWSECKWRTVARRSSKNLSHVLTTRVILTNLGMLDKSIKLYLMITQAGKFRIYINIYIYIYICLQLMMSSCQYPLLHEALWFSCINIPHNVLLQDDRHC